MTGWLPGGVQALATLYGLVRVEKAAAFLLAAGALSSADAKALRCQINDLCAGFAGVRRLLGAPHSRAACMHP